MDWPLIKAIDGNLRQVRTVRSIGGVPITRNARQLPEFVPVKNWRSAQVQEKKIEEVQQPIDSKNEIDTSVQPVPEAVLERKRALQLQGQDEATEAKKARKVDKLKTIFDA